MTGRDSKLAMNMKGDLCVSSSCDGLDPSYHLQAMSGVEELDQHRCNLSHSDIATAHGQDHIELMEACYLAAFIGGVLDAS